MSNVVQMFKRWFASLDREEQEQLIEYLYEDNIISKGLYFGPSPGMIKEGVYCGPKPSLQQVVQKNVCPTCGRSN